MYIYVCVYLCHNVEGLITGENPQQETNSSLANSQIKNPYPLKLHWAHILIVLYYHVNTHARSHTHAHQQMGMAFLTTQFYVQSHCVIPQVSVFN